MRKNSKASEKGTVAITVYISTDYVLMGTIGTEWKIAVKQILKQSAILSDMGKMVEKHVSILYHQYNLGFGNYGKNHHAKPYEDSNTVVNDQHGRSTWTVLSQSL